MKQVLWLLWFFFHISMSLFLLEINCMKLIATILAIQKNYTMCIVKIKYLIIMIYS